MDLHVLAVKMSGGVGELKPMKLFTSFKKDRVIQGINQAWGQFYVAECQGHNVHPDSPDESDDILCVLCCSNLLCSIIFTAKKINN